MRELNLQKARLAKVGVAAGRKEAKREVVREVIGRDVQHTERKALEYKRAAETRDPRMEVFLALRAAGKSRAEADAEVERQFGTETPNERTEDNADDSRSGD